MKLTNEQQNILNLIKNGEKFLKIIAFARTGKTTLLIETAKQTKGKKLYIAFNKAIANEASEKFKGTNTWIKTTHLLAYNYVINRYGYKLTTKLFYNGNSSNLGTD
jgi:F-box protein 18 (helicase)